MADEYESFIGKVSGYEDALRSEYEVASSTDDLATIRKIIEKKIAVALPGFVDDLILIARAGDTDASRMKAIQFAFNWYFKESTSADDPFSALLTQLTATDQNPQLRPKITPHDPTLLENDPLAQELLNEATDPNQLDITGGQQ